MSFQASLKLKTVTHYGYLYFTHIPIIPIKININKMITKCKMEKLLGKPRQIDNRNRITLPPELLKLLDLKPGDEVFFKVIGDKII